MWFEHVSTSEGLVKTILQGTVQGGRRRGRQKKRWENNISEWTGLKFCDALREAENEIKWRERVARSVALQQSPYKGIGTGVWCYLHVLLLNDHSIGLSVYQRVLKPQM